MHSGGLCTFKDGRTNTDGGHKCAFWKAVPYDRLAEKKIASEYFI